MLQFQITYLPNYQFQAHSYTNLYMHLLLNVLHKQIWGEGNWHQLFLFHHQKVSKAHCNVWYSYFPHLFIDNWLLWGLCQSQQYHLHMVLSHGQYQWISDLFIMFRSMYSWSFCAWSTHVSQLKDAAMHESISFLILSKSADTMVCKSSCTTGCLIYRRSKSKGLYDLNGSL